MTLRFVTMAVLVGAAMAFAADVPLDGTKLGIHERAGRTPRSDVSCRDASVALPGPGGAGDPSLGGATIEITIDAGGGAPFIARPVRDGRWERRRCRISTRATWRRRAA
jgi:hypothetical protein